MLFRTHLLFGIFISLIITKTYNPSLLFCFLIIFASTLPDIDSSKSKISIPFISNFIERVFGHRGILHSIYPLLFFLFLSIYSFYFLAIFIGYASHILIDCLTKEGIRILYPIINIKISGFIKTNSFLENLFLILLFLATLLLIFL
ncbi:MAG TPA: metal-dependent hydrolase [Candidatus Nanoarchaeia archaeon]|nr:metal-dependent hydrolase [Candidatus Nanoarchaeia archaeon]